MVDAVHHLVVTGSDYLTSVDILCASSATVSCGSSVWNATSVILLPLYRSFTADWTFLIPAALAYRVKSSIWKSRRKADFLVPVVLMFLHY